MLIVILLFPFQCSSDSSKETWWEGNGSFFFSNRSFSIVKRVEEVKGNFSTQTIICKYHNLILLSVETSRMSVRNNPHPHILVLFGDYVPIHISSP